MINIINWISLIMGIYFIAFSFINNTNSISASIVYKVIPFFGGVCITINMLNTMGFIRIF